MDYYCSISVVLLVFDEIIVFVWHRVQGIDGLLLSPFYPTKKIPRLSRIFIDILRCKMNIFFAYCSINFSTSVQFTTFQKAFA